MPLGEFGFQVEELHGGALMPLQPPEQRPLSEEEESEVPFRKKSRLTSKIHWRRDMLIGIRAASIAVQAQDFIKRGRGAPGPDDMCRFSEEAEAVARLWKDTYLDGCDDRA